MKQTVLEGEGSLKKLPELLEQLGAKKIFLVTGKSNYQKTEILNLLAPWTIQHFNEFSPNPEWKEIEKGLALFKSGDWDTVVGLGGGSALDVAKIIRYEGRPSSPFIAIPTTAGTGSESTQFATYYKGHEKQSLDKTEALPNFALLDPELTYGLPPYVTACTGMDALAQSIESYWNVQSTEESRQLAREAIKILWNNIEVAVNAATPEARKAMLLGSNLAGRAINITRTTASHAISYPLTSFFNIPHGHAVNLTLPYFLEVNDGVTEADCVDPRGRDFVKKNLKEIYDLLGAKDGKEGRDLYLRKMEKISLSSSMQNLGIKESDIVNIVKNSFNPARMKNNPRRVDESSLTDLLNKIYFGTRLLQQTTNK